MTQFSEPRLELYFLNSATKSIVGLCGQLTALTVPRLAGLLPKLGFPRAIELDLSELAFIDEDGLQALKFFERRCAAKGIVLIIGHPRPFVRRLLNRAGVRGMLAPSFPLRRITGVKAIYRSPQVG